MTSPPPAAAHQAFLQQRHFGALDGLRGLSILAVVWHHAGDHAGVLGKGYVGVDLFFAVSGLLITTLLLRERDRTGGISLRGFYVRRTLRIFPLYYAVVALYAVLVAWLERGTPAGEGFAANLPAFLTYTSNWFVDRHAGPRVIFYFAWSLATEEQFYLLWPWAVRYLRAWILPPLLMTGLLLAGEVSRWAVQSGRLDPAPLLVKVLTSVATPICLGCLAAYLLHRPAGFRWAWRAAGRPWSAPLAAGLLALLLAAEDPPAGLVALAMTGLVVACSIRPDHALRPLLENRALRYLGTVSYGVYLLHMLAINASRRVVPGGGAPLRFAVAVALAVAVASVSYRWFEKPILSLKRLLEAPAAPRPVPAAAAEPAAGA